VHFPPEENAERGAVTVDEGRPVKRRQVDTTNKDARIAVRAVVRALEPLRSRTALIAASALHGVTESERQSLLAECGEIAAGCREARQSLIIGLMDAPRKVAGHSRVLDVEKAIDSLEAAVEQARSSLS